MRKKCLILGVVLMMCLGHLAGCRGEKELPYNAELNDNAGELIFNIFKESNKTTGIVNDGDDLPKWRVWLLTTKESYEEIIQESTLQVDFDKQMLIIYTFTTDYVRPCQLSKILIDADVLKIEFAMTKPKGAVGGAVRDYQRWFIIKLDKIEVTSVEVVEVIE